MAVSYNVVIDQGADWYINFVYKQPAEITNIVGDGTTVTYTAANGLTPGQVVSIDGVIPSQYNLQNVVVVTATSTDFTVTNGATGIYISGGIATAPYDITGFSGRMQLRSLPDSPEFVLELTTDNGGIAINGPDGVIAVHATSAQTTAIDEGPYYYDLEIESNSNIVTRVAQGQAIVSAEVTR
jgi:hypothetical protein